MTSLCYVTGDSNNFDHMAFTLNHVVTSLGSVANATTLACLHSLPVCLLPFPPPFIPCPLPLPLPSPSEQGPVSPILLAPAAMGCVSGQRNGLTPGEGDLVTHTTQHCSVTWQLCGDHQEWVWDLTCAILRLCADETQLVVLS